MLKACDFSEFSQQCSQDIPQNPGLNSKHYNGGSPLKGAK